MSDPTNTTADHPAEAEALERIRAMVDDDRTLHGAILVGDTEYAWIYVTSTTGRYNGNAMLWLRYVWLSKPGAYENDMWGDNGVSMRLVDGLLPALTALMGRTNEGHKRGAEEAEPLYREEGQYAESGDS